MVPETGIEPVRCLSAKRRILSPLCLPISPLGPRDIEGAAHAIVKPTTSPKATAATHYRDNPDSALGWRRTIPQRCIGALKKQTASAREAVVVSGGGGRNRTGVDGFAGRCITTLLPRQGSHIAFATADNHE